MKIKEILEIESNNGGVINLFLEGIFWKAYEQSVSLFSANVEAFAINRKMIKNVQKEIVSLGFPEISLAKLFDKSKIIVVNEKYIKIEGYDFDGHEYESWRRLISTNSKAVTMKFPVSKADEILNKIRRYRIDNSTPWECMEFIISIQKELDGCI